MGGGGGAHKHNEHKTHTSCEAIEVPKRKRLIKNMLYLIRDGSKSKHSQGLHTALNQLRSLARA